MRAPLHILHLENDLNDAELVRRALDSEGIEYTTRRVEERGEFVAALEGGGIDLILSDFALPSFDAL